MTTEIFEPGRQYDLFGEDLAAQEREQQALADLAKWRERFERVEWRSGLPNLSPTLGYRCPSCGDVEPNEFLLSINHGYDPGVPGRAPLDDRCFKARWGGDSR